MRLPPLCAGGSVLNHLKAKLGDGGTHLMKVCRDGKHVFVAAYSGFVLGNTVSDSLGGLSHVCEAAWAFYNVDYEVGVARMIVLDVVPFARPRMCEKVSFGDGRALGTV